MMITNERTKDGIEMAFESGFIFISSHKHLTMPSHKETKCHSGQRYDSPGIV